ncbi:MAG: hypothetical protein ACREDR_45580, partial [Blastocatellia bacterium]
LRHIAIPQVQLDQGYRRQYAKCDPRIQGFLATPHQAMAGAFASSPTGRRSSRDTDGGGLARQVIPSTL